MAVYIYLSVNIFISRFTPGETAQPPSIEFNTLQGIGFGGTTMIEAEDYLVCTVDDENAICEDRAPVSRCPTAVGC